ncbi:hypothetical protein F1C58_01080 [Glaciihabitans sp. INWT7]|uniref:hypothetical protein n=1 Tax=Glaciihabitans sp. INWT7 TaxID=2596912 RepID=UPI0016268A4E|nr:hypothetical protein [Glaciihabitans sp. INWT7]QNE45654.1 hypothetical protein F1C58_01080 [Glaciihabitans sp. INWT7]
MTAGFSISLAVVCALIVVARFVLPQVPLARAGVRVSATEVAFLGLGIVGLTFHCTAMFFRQVFSGMPAVRPLVDAVNGMGAASIALYVVPAVLLLIGLRRQHRIALAVMTLALIAVGLTMYLGSPLRLHLASIFLAVVLLVGVLSLLVRGPCQPKDAGAAAPPA